VEAKDKKADVKTDVKVAKVKNAAPAKAVAELKSTTAKLAEEKKKTEALKVEKAKTKAAAATPAPAPVVVNKKTDTPPKKNKQTEKTKVVAKKEATIKAEA